MARKKKLTRFANLDQQIERDIATRAARARKEDEAASEFYARHPHVQSFKSSQNEIDVMRSVLEGERRSLVREI